MKLDALVDWLNAQLEVSKFDDVSNNGVQIARTGNTVTRAAFAVDASVAAIEAAAKKRAQLLVVHHGISWGGGIRRISGGVYAVVKAAMKANLAVYACHLPLDASEKYGNNWELARYLGLTGIQPAFSYHGNVIGVTGYNPHGQKIGICSGGAGEFAEEAQHLGCAVYVTGEANWGEVIAAENCGMKMITAGHYQTEVFGVRALARAVRKTFAIETFDLTDLLSK